jgi:hypothetical protein
MSSESSRPAGLLQAKQKSKFKSNLIENVLLVCDGESVLENSFWGERKKWTHKKLLFLTFPEQNIRIPGGANRDDTTLARDSLAILEFDVIRYKDMSEQSFDFVCCHEPSRAVKNE